MPPPVPVHVTVRMQDLPERISDLVWRWEERRPDAPALIDGDIRWRFADLAAAVRGAMALLRDNGIRAGDRVMLVNENGRAIVALFLAATALDAWSIVVNARQSPAESMPPRDMLEFAGRFSPSMFHPTRQSMQSGWEPRS